MTCQKNSARTPHYWKVGRSKRKFSSDWSQTFSELFGTIKSNFLKIIFENSPKWTFVLQKNSFLNRHKSMNNHGKMKLNQIEVFLHQQKIAVCKVWCQANKEQQHFHAKLLDAPHLEEPARAQMLYIGKWILVLYCSEWILTTDNYLPVFVFFR